MFRPTAVLCHEWPLGTLTTAASKSNYLTLPLPTVQAGWVGISAAQICWDRADGCLCLLLILVKLKVFSSGLGPQSHKKICQHPRWETTHWSLKIKCIYVGNKLSSELGLGYPWKVIWRNINSKIIWNASAYKKLKIILKDLQKTSMQTSEESPVSH